MDLSDTEKLELAPQATYSPHPLIPGQNRVVINDQLLPGETIAQYLERTGLAARIGHRPVRVTINGWRVSREIWAACRPKPGTQIHVQAEVHDGGGDDNKVIRAVLMVALVAAGQYWVLPGYGAVATGVFVVVGGLAFNALFPPPKPKLPTTDTQADSPNYSLAGGSNQARPYQPMPVIIGTTRYYPDLGAKPYTEFEGAEQVLYQIFDCGYNDIDCFNFQIGDTPISNYKGVVIEESSSDGKLTLFPSNVDTIDGSELTHALGWISRTTSDVSTAIAVEITGSLFKVNDDGSLGENVVVIAIEYRKVGDADWTPVTVDDDTLPIRIAPSFDEVALYSYGEDGPNIIDTLRYNAIRLDTSDWNDINANPLPAGQLRIRNSSRRALRKTYKWNVDAGQYEVRVQRVTADSSSTSDASDIVWSQLRSYQPDTADYTGRKRFAMKIRASGQLNGSVEQFNFLAKAKTQIWTGSAWQLNTTSNPAWWLLQAYRGVFAGSRRAWGAGLDDTKIDIDGIKAFGAFCDTFGLTADGVFDQPITVNDMLGQIALRGRATISQGTGKYGVVWDTPGQPVVAHFSMANIKAGTFEISYATEDLADEVVVTFNNPEKGYKQDTVRLLAPGVTNPTLTKQIDTTLCASQTLAAQDGNLYLAGNIYRARKYTWQMDFEGMPVSRGEVGILGHDLASFDVSGRLAAGSSDTVLQLDREVTLADEGNFVTVVKPDGTQETVGVEGPSADTTTLTLSSALSFNPSADVEYLPQDYKFLFSSSGATPGRKVKVDSIRPVDESTVEITAVDETPFYYQAANGTFFTPPVKVFGATPQISSVVISENAVRAANGYTVRADIDWTITGDFSFADVRITVNGELAQLLQTTRSSHAEVLTPDGSTVEVEVTAYGMYGRSGTFARTTYSKVLDYAGLFPPSNVTGFRLDGKTFRWVEVPDYDVVGYIIRFHYGENTNASDALPLHDGLLTYTPKTFEDGLPIGTCTFFITAVDAAGLESTTPTVLVKDMGDLGFENAVYEIDFKAGGFAGTITGGTVAGSGDLEADDTSDFYRADSGPFYGDDDADFYADIVYADLVYETEAFFFPTNVVGNPLLLDHELEGQAISIEFRTGNGDPFYGDGAADFYGADADPFYGEPTAYQPWIGSLTAESIDYQLRVSISSGAVQGAIRSLSAIVDVADIDEFLSNVEIPAGGARLPITNTYNAIKNVQLTLISSAGSTAVSTKVLDMDVSGPFAQAIDSSGASVDGFVNAHIRGY